MLYICLNVSFILSLHMTKKNFFILSLFLAAFAVRAQDVKLPPPVKTGGKTLMDALSERKSTRDFRDGSLPVQTLSDLLWAANGFNRPGKRTAPTANNRQELELYIAVKDGLYFYNAKNNVLKLIKKGDYRKNTGTQEY